MTTLLLIDDNADDQFIACHYLARVWPQVKVLTAFDGIEAIELLENHRQRLPDLILLDINMPRMNGHEFLQAWYHDSGMQIPVVVMLTSSEQASDRQKTDAFACVTDYITKPLSRSTVARLGPMLMS